MQSLFSRVLPFIILGITLLVFLAGLILLSYFLVFGALLGLVLFGIAWFKEKLFSPKLPVKRKNRTFDHNDLS